MDDITYRTLTETIGNLTLQNKQLKRANTQLKKEKKRMGRAIKKLKDEAAMDKKPRFKNGKRGSKFNG